jgi:hypothetical protein
MKQKSAVETIAGSPGTTLAVNAAPLLAQLFPSVGAVVGATGITLLSAVPFLSGTLAAGRQTARIEANIKALAESLAQVQCDLSDLTDDQYKLASECSLAFLSTINVAKLTYLRQAIHNTLVDSSVAAGVPEVLGRLIRDISAAETALVLELFKYRVIQVGEGVVGVETFTGTWTILRGSPEEVLIQGLVSIGLLITTKSAFNSTGYVWSPLTAKFIALVRPPSGNASGE